MSLGALTIVKSIELGNAKLVSATLVGDSAYPSGGSSGLLAKVRAALGDGYTQILSVQNEHNADARLEYIPPVFTTAGDPTTAVASGDKLFVRVPSTGAESAVSDQSGTTYNLTLIAY